MQLSGSADAQRAIISAQEKNLPATVTLCGPFKHDAADQIADILLLNDAPTSE